MVQKSGYKNSPGDYTVLYEYKILGASYHCNNSFYYCGDLDLNKINGLLENKSFPVAYAINVHKLGKIFLTQKDADEFNYPLPDSLLIYDSVLTCK